jgi:hypothetical protein
MTRRAGLPLVAALLAACSGIKTYPDVQPRNLKIHGEASSGSVFSTVRASVHIHRIDAKCQSDYLGTVRVEERTADVGIPAGRTSLLAVTFFSSSILSYSNSSTRYETLLTPRPGYSYDMKISYAEDIYSVMLREIDPRGSRAHEIARVSPDSCKPS